MKNIKKGSIVKCEVSGITDYGVFVKLDEGYSGLIHISELSEKFVSNIERLYIKGDIIEAKVIEVDKDKKQVKLSLKDNELLNNSKKAIVEKGRGFEPLKESLDLWVKEKLEDLEKNAKTP